MSCSASWTVCTAVNLNETFDVSAAKLQELKARIARLGIDVRLIEECFIRGGGKGGQIVAHRPETLDHAGQRR